MGVGFLHGLNPKELTLKQTWEKIAGVLLGNEDLAMSPLLHWMAKLKIG
jgi:hypothetical protein